ncbi:hypothetical protein EHS43_21165 [Streptomyces sp. RP5T]|nr:hypothetical protein EHS43_21165 [Streptomyces sp. RP5T]
MISGNHTSRSSREKAAGTRTYITCRPAVLTSARSAAAYSGSSTRSCSTAAPTNHSAIPNRSPASSSTPAYPARANEQTSRRSWRGLPRGIRITGLRRSVATPTWC